MAKKKVAKKSSSKKSPPKRKTAKPGSVSYEEKQMGIIEEYLQELYHLSGHLVQAGIESEKPWQQIMSSMVYLHNQLAENADHQIQSINLACSCPLKEHTIKPRHIEHECGDMH